MRAAGGYTGGPSRRGMHHSADAAGWILQIALNADRDSFIALFEHYAPRVKSHLLRLGLSEGLSEDLAQETLLRVWRRAAAFDPQRASPAAWIFTIARNLRIDALRRERRPSDLLQAEEDIEALTPEQELRERQHARRLRQAIGELPPLQSQILQLAYFEERSHANIARQLALPLGTVKSRIRLAAASLRLALHELA